MRGTKRHPLSTKVNEEIFISAQNQKTSLEELIERAQAGDSSAYREFLKSIYPYIQSALRQKLGSLVDQEDLAQECLVGIHKNLATYQPGKPVKPWVSAIIRYKLADHFRSLARKKEQTFSNLELDVTNVAEEPNEYDEAHHKDAVEILDKVPEKLRRAIELTHIKGLSYEEAAQKEGINEAALRKRISRGFSKIRQVVTKGMEI